MKKVRVIFSPEAEEVYKHLNEIVAFVLDILNHKDYDKKFGYK